MQPNRHFILTTHKPFTTIFEGLTVRSIPDQEGHWQTLIQASTPGGSVAQLLELLEADANVISYRMEA